MSEPAQITNERVSFKKCLNLDDQSQDFPIPESIRFSYGTAGFRTKARYLSFLSFRVGVLASLRSLDQNKAIGVMITASHNPEEDNGVKVVEPGGEMLAVEWESIASELVNSSDDSFESLVTKYVSDLALINREGTIFAAHDTRASSPQLFQYLKAGIEWASTFLGRDVVFVPFGLLTTPQLHFIVARYNKKLPATESSYIETMTKNFLKLTEKGAGSYQPKLYLDAANGIGATKILPIATKLAGDNFSIVIHNNDTTPGSGNLNNECGADFVKIKKTFPKLNGGDQLVFPGQKWASFDGDADRLVYFYATDSGEFRLVDGDKIAVLFAEFIKKEMAAAASKMTHFKKEIEGISVGVVQTAYANGASSKYIREQLGLEALYAATGVKHLHKAAEKFDVGIYFEANGHGTIRFSAKLREFIAKNSYFHEHIENLKDFFNLINEYVGDAIADMLAVEAILIKYDWSVEQWDLLYQDYPSVQLKVQVPDRSVIKTIPDETKCLEPAELQEKIDSIIAEFPSSRAFVRPSGTEDYVRVYAEAQTEEMATKVGSLVRDAVLQCCDISSDK